MNPYIRSKPTACTPKFLKLYRKMILVGTKPLTAARAAGISDSTYYAWLKEAKENSEEKPAAKLILEFLEITEQSRAEFVAATMAKATCLITSTKDALDVLRASVPEEFAINEGERQDLTVNQVIIGIIGEVAIEQRKILDIQRAKLDYQDAEYRDLSGDDDE